MTREELITQRDEERAATAAEEELIEYLESDQLVSERARPVPPARLSHRASVLLWALRVFVIVLGVMVIYTFCAQLG